MNGNVSLKITEQVTQSSLVVKEISTQVNLTVEDIEEQVIINLHDGKGASAYEIWLSEGKVGTPSEFIASLANVSNEPNNRIKLLDDGLHVIDDLTPDPLAYYILSRS